MFNRADRLYQSTVPVAKNFYSDKLDGYGGTRKRDSKTCEATSIDSIDTVQVLRYTMNVCGLECKSKCKRWWRLRLIMTMDENKGPRIRRV